LHTLDHAHPQLTHDIIATLVPTAHPAPGHPAPGTRAASAIALFAHPATMREYAYAYTHTLLQSHKQQYAAQLPTLARMCTHRASQYTHTLLQSHKQQYAAQLPTLARMCTHRASQEPWRYHREMSDLDTVLRARNVSRTSRYHTQRARRQKGRWGATSAETVAVQHLSAAAASPLAPPPPR